MRVQQKQLVMLEADVVERQRVLQDNILRLKLMTTPIRQDWADVCAVPAAANRHTEFGEKDHNWVRYYVRLFQNKKLVCWLSQSHAEDDSTPALMIDLFDVVEVQPWQVNTTSSMVVTVVTVVTAVKSHNGHNGRNDRDGRVTGVTVVTYLAGGPRAGPQRAAEGRGGRLHAARGRGRRHG